MEYLSKVSSGLSGFAGCAKQCQWPGPALALAIGLSASSLPAMSEETVLAPGVIAVIDRTEIEMSGLASLGDLLSSRSHFNAYGIRGLSSGRGVVYTLDGRRTSDLDLDTIPLSAVERIEIMDESEARISRHTFGVIVNVVLKHGLEGTETLGTFGRPVLEGADMNQGGGVWGGRLGSGHVLVAVDRASVQEVPDAARDFSRAEWTAGGSFAGTQGVSEAGNTIYIDDVGARALGECNTDIYTGILQNPKGVSGEGCGFAYADIAWMQGRVERDSLLLSVEHPFGDNAELYLNVVFARTDSHERFAPTAGNFEFVPAGSVRDSIIAAIDGLTAGDLPVGTQVSVDHRFVAHGNRDWLTTSDRKGLTLGVHGELANGFEYDIRGSIYRNKARLVADTFVSKSLVEEAVASGDYLIMDPFSTDPGHVDVIRRTSVRQFNNTDTDYNVLRAELAGKSFDLPGGPADWTVAVEFVDTDWQSIYDYRDGEGDAREVTDVLGAGGSSVTGKRTTASLHAGTTLPVHSDLDLVLAGSRSDHDDVGGTAGWNVAGHYSSFEPVILRVQRGWYESAPGLGDLNRPTFIDFPYICDTSLDECSNQQVERVRGGNPELEPSETEYFRLGMEWRSGRHRFGIDWFRSESTGLPSQVSPQYLVNLNAAGGDLPPGAAVIRDGTNRIDRIVSPLLNSGESKSRGIALMAGTAWETEWAKMELDARVRRQTRSIFKVAGARQPGDFPRYRAHATLKASRNDVTASWNTYFVSGFWNATRTGRYSSWTGHDLALHWKDAFDVDGLAIAGGILNVANNGPALNPATPDSPSITGDSLRGRSFFLRTSVSF